MEDAELSEGYCLECEEAWLQEEANKKPPSTAKTDYEPLWTQAFADDGLRLGGAGSEDWRLAGEAARGGTRKKKKILFFDSHCHPHLHPGGAKGG